MARQDGRTAVFIDGANLYNTTKALGFDLDYRKLTNWVESNFEPILRMSYYTAIIEDHEYSSIRPLLDYLEYNGFTLVTKPCKSFDNEDSGRRTYKGNMDIELAVDMMDTAAHAENIILFSGDGDFRSLVANVQRKGCRVFCISTIKSQPRMLADELRRQVDEFIELESIRKYVERDPSTRTTEPGERRKRFEQAEENQDTVQAPARNAVAERKHL